MKENKNVVALSKKPITLQLVMVRVAKVGFGSGSGIASRVRVGFGFIPSGSCWVRVILVGFGSGFRVLKYGIFDPLSNFYCIFMQ